MERYPTDTLTAMAGPAYRYDLSESFGPNLTLHQVLGDEDIELGYGTVPGDPRLRAAIAAQHGVTAEDVVVTVGGMHALSLLALVLCDQDHEAVTTAPVFPLARTALQAAGARIRSVQLSFDDGYAVSPDALRTVLSDRTRLVSLASPQNPSATTIPFDTLRSILASMRTICPGATLLVDETYRQAAYGDDAIAPSAVTLDDRVVSVASLSKTHGAPGVRIGWAITRDQALRQQLIAAKFNTVIACSTIDEALAIKILAQDRGSRRQHFAAGLALTAAWVDAHASSLAWIRPDAGSICCVRLRPERFSDDAVTGFYAELEARGIRVASGRWFGESARVFRLGFGLLPIPDLEIALAGMSAALNKVSKR